MVGLELLNEDEVAKWEAESGDLINVNQIKPVTNQMFCSGMHEW